MGLVLKKGVRKATANSGSKKEKEHIKKALIKMVTSGEESDKLSALSSRDTSIKITENTDELNNYAHSKSNGFRLYTNLESKRANLLKNTVKGRFNAGDCENGRISKRAKRDKRRLQWLEHVETKALGHLESTKSSVAPLNHLDALKATLEVISVPSTDDVAEIQVAKKENHTISSRGSRARKQALKIERDQFAAVLRHPVFRKDPLGTIHTHLSNRGSSS